MEPENLNQEESHLAPLQKITPLSKYLALALFIILPFLGGWIGYTYAPEKVMEIERVVVKEVPAEPTTDVSVLNDSGSLGAEISDSQTSGVVFPKSQEYALNLPSGWSVEQIEDKGYYFFDEVDKLAFRLTYPILETSYPETTRVNQRTMETAIGNLDVLDWKFNGNLSAGWVRYSWSGLDFFRDSFEIFVPIRDELYARTAAEQQAGGGVETKYKSFEEYKADQAVSALTIDQIISEGITLK
jgi:hypothetical protein